jgi:hypothetical protein
MFIFVDMEKDEKLKLVRVDKTGQMIEVYKTKRGTWCDYKDCKTEYKDSELTFGIDPNARGGYNSPM